MNKQLKFYLDSVDKMIKKKNYDSAQENLDHAYIIMISDNIKTERYYDLRDKLTYNHYNNL